MNIHDEGPQPGSPQYILDQHDALVDEAAELDKKKDKKKIGELQEQILGLRQEYNDAIGRIMFKI